MTVFSAEDISSLRRKCIEVKALYDASDVERQHLSRIVTSLTHRYVSSLRWNKIWP